MKNRPAAARACAAFALVLPALLASPARSALLQVGAGHSLKGPSAAAAIAADGDVIEIEAGTYLGDVAVWRANDLTIRAVGGRVRLPG